MNKKLLQWLNLLSFIVTVIINYAATGLRLGGYNTGELSDLIPNLFVPAGLTFSIWGVIYFFLAGYSIYQVRSSQTGMEYQDQIGYYFILNGIFNSTWIFLWHFRLVPLSLIIMILILISLIMIYLRLNIGKSEVSRGKRIWVHTPFSIYLGWITVATIANVTAVLVVSGVPNFGLIPEILTIIVIAVAVLITYAMLFIRKDWVYSLVILWATLGIYFKQSLLNSTIATTALIAVIIVAVGIVYTWFRLIKE